MEQDEAVLKDTGLDKEDWGMEYCHYCGRIGK